MFKHTTKGYPANATAEKQSAAGPRLVPAVSPATKAFLAGLGKSDQFSFEAAWKRFNAE